MAEPAEQVEGGFGAEARRVDAPEFVEERVGGYKRPREYEVRDELPRTDSGKLLKRLLRRNRRRPLRPNRRFTRLAPNRTGSCSSDLLTRVSPTLDQWQVRLSNRR